MKKRYAIPLALLCMTALAAGITYTVLPWKSFAGQRLQSILNGKGFENVRLTVDQAGLTGATLKDITIGNETPLTLRDLAVKYDIRELWEGNLRDLVVDDLALTVRQTETGWAMQGFRAREGGAPFRIPVTAADAHTRVPFDTVEAINGKLSLVAKDWQADMKLDAQWRRLPQPGVDVKAPSITFKKDALEITAEDAKASATLPADAAEWTGTWDAKNIRVKDNDLVPAMDAAGSVKARADTIAIDGALKSADGKTAASFTLAQNLADPAQNRLTVTSARMPWKNGTLSVRNVAIPLTDGAPIRFNLQVQNVSVDELMQAMTGKRVTATGAVSGSVPLVWHRDGRILPGDGLLQAGEPGTITMPPDTIPGDNEQVALTRSILSNFRYDKLTITTDRLPDGGMAVLLTLEGNNPGVMDGRAVKLNVRLTGDILDFVRQNVILLTKPETLLQQDNHD